RRSNETGLGFMGYNVDVDKNLTILNNSSNDTKDVNDRIATLEGQHAILFQGIANLSSQCNSDVLNNLTQKNDEMFAKIMGLLNTMNSSIAELRTQVQNIDKNGTFFPTGTKNNTDGDTDKIDLDRLVNQARVRVFSGENYEGKYEDLDFSTNSKCQRLRGSLLEKVRSVDTNGTCVRLFLTGTCVGWSAAIYPGTGNSKNVLNSKLTTVTSVGPCLREEFEGAKAVPDPSGQKISKDSTNPQNYVPDLIEFESWNLYENGVRLTISEVNSIRGYYRGQGDRLEYVSALVRNIHLNSSARDTGSIQNSSYWESIDKKEGDIVGFVIPLALGGPSNETYNVFPQTPKGAAEWKERTTFISECIKSHPGADLWISTVFLFPNEQTKRPSWFTYRIRCAKEVSYGIVKN
ncbi:unnamed protein product, partial [Allacma fusca]